MNDEILKFDKNGQWSLEKAKIIDMKSRKVLADLPSETTPKKSVVGRMRGDKKAGLAGRISPGTGEHAYNLVAQETPHLLPPKKLVKSFTNGQWTMDETLEKATHERVAGPTEATLDRANKLKEMKEHAVSGKRNINPEHLPKPGETRSAHKARVMGAIKAKHPSLSDAHINAAVDAHWEH